MSRTVRGSIDGIERISWSPQAMRKPARRRVIAIGTTDTPELESRRLMSADLPEFAAEFAEASKPQMPAKTIVPQQIVILANSPFSKDSVVSPSHKPVDIVPVSFAIRTLRPEYAAFRQIQRGPDHFQTSLGDPFSVKFGSPMNGNADISAGNAQTHDPAGSKASSSPSSGDFDHSAMSVPALDLHAPQSVHVMIRSQSGGNDILSRAFELANDRLITVWENHPPMMSPYQVVEPTEVSAGSGGLSPAPAFIAVPHRDDDASSIDATAMKSASGQPRHIAPATVSAGSQPNDAGRTAETAGFRAGDRETADESREVPILGAIGRSVSPRPLTAREFEEPDLPPATEAESKDDIWSRISDAFDLDDTGFEPIGEPLDDSVEIDEDELSAAVDRVLEGFAFPVEDSFESPRIGTTIGLAAGTAITVGIVLRRRRDSESRNGQRGQFEFDRTTQVRPDLDENAAGH